MLGVTINELEMYVDDGCCWYVFLKCKDLICMKKER